MKQPDQQTQPTPPAEPLAAAELYLEMLRRQASGHDLLDVRYRVRGQDLGRFFMGTHALNAARMILRIGQRTDVYVGCAPRIRRRGSRADIAPTALLWADCDGAVAVAALHAFAPVASMVVTTGGADGNAHAYWALTHALELHRLEDANRRLAAALGADPACADGARVLRVPGTRNFKHNPPRAVSINQCSGAVYELGEILARLPAAPSLPARKEAHRTPGPCDDPLRSIEPARYVSVLTGAQPGDDGKICCPLHEDKTPSFHVYPTAAEGWTCFGCARPDGKPVGGDIYTLASALWGIPARGRGFIELRARLDELFSVERTGPTP